MAMATAFKRLPDDNLPFSGTHRTHHPSVRVNPCAPAIGTFPGRLRDKNPPASLADLTTGCFGEKPEGIRSGAPTKRTFQSDPLFGVDVFLLGHLTPLHLSLPVLSGIRIGF